MNPALAALSSGGFAGAVVVVINAIFGWLTGKAVDPNIVAAETTIVTTLTGVGIHWLSLPAAAAAPAPNPTASGNQAP